jgi:predicted ABC-type ATPase
MFAGPNGSGKSVLIKDLKWHGLPLGPVVNADYLLGELQRAQFIDLSSFCLRNISQQEWDSAINRIKELSSRIDKMGREPAIEIRNDVLICRETYLNAYTAALTADFIRYMLVEQDIDFSFETVMSHRSKVKFLDFAKQKGYKVYLYYLATNDSSINIDRVKKRVQQGGHDVPEGKIEARYERSLNLLYDAYKIADRAFIMDSSREESTVIFEKKNDGKGDPQVEYYPQWFENSVNKKLG